MNTIREFRDGHGVVWLMTKCHKCREIHKYLATYAATGDVKCKSCGAAISMHWAVPADRDFVTAALIHTVRVRAA
jgi:ribosomal protein S27E